jgi:hypothetical protein
MVAPLAGVLAPLTAPILNPLDQVLRPVTRVLDPVTRPLCQVLSPLSGVLSPVTALVGTGTGTLVGSIGGALAPATADQPGLPVPDGSGRSGGSGGTGDRAAPAGPTERCTSAGGEHSSTSSSALRQPAGAVTRTAANPAGGAGSTGPQWPLRVPLGGYLGGGTGSGTTGSGSPTGGGSFALAPHPVASDTVGSHRLRPSSEVEVMRLVAQTPTVSPD